MPDSESREYFILGGGVFALLGCAIPWFSVPNAFAGNDPRTYGLGNVNSGWRWIIIVSLIVMSVLALWARNPTMGLGVCAFSMFVVFLTLATVMLAAGQAATKADFLREVGPWGVLPILIANALVVTGAVRAAGGALHREELDYLHRSSDLTRAEVREMKNVSRAPSPSGR